MKVPLKRHILDCLKEHGPCHFIRLLGYLDQYHLPVSRAEITEKLNYMVRSREVSFDGIHFKLYERNQQ